MKNSPGLARMLCLGVAGVIIFPKGTVCFTEQHGRPAQVREFW